MSKLSRILAPTDFSASGIRALTHAAAIAAHTSAELYVLYVQVFNRDLYGWSAIPNIEEIEKTIGDLARQGLDKAVEGVPQAVVHETIKDTREAPAILRYAEARDIDLIVMGTHARKGASRLFLGSVTAEVLRHAPVSVLAIGPEHGLPTGSYSQVLAPVDFSDSSIAALQQASAIAKLHDAQLTVMHVVEPRVPTPYDTLVESLDEVRDRAIETMDKFLANVELPQAPQHKTVVIGPADDQIVSVAREHGADLIVMGTVGRSGLGRLLLGSTTERVLRNAPCAVLAHRGEVYENM